MPKTLTIYIFIILYLAILVFIFFGLPHQVTHGQGNSKWIVYFLIIFILPFLLYYILTEFDVADKIKNAIAALSILIVGPLYGTYMSSETKKNLQEYGIETKGIVFKKFQSENTGKWQIRCSFKVNNKSYSTFSETDKYNCHKIGDTLTILYNSSFPEECRILELQ